MDLKTYLAGGRGRGTALANAIGAHASDVSAWASEKRPRPIPIHFGLPIEKATKGLVSRREMFPEATIRKVWPELLKQKNGKVDRLAASDDTQPPVGGTPDKTKQAKAVAA